ncbi:MAG TPA: lysylphosphatidylglycerol synthase domain-containing protein [Candidatus Sulfotelmatobacter sp.]|nr:lysylphosphatidylglycerol synthase domain-containing protein [Candidatus Sulfotelmatobacter sp.]
MKVAAWIGLFAGAALATVLIAHYGWLEIGRALGAIGWTGFGIVIAIHLVLMGVMGFAWFVLAARAPGARLRLFVWGRLVRDSASEVLPLSQVGGYVAGACAIALGGAPFALAAASTLVDVTLEVAAQLVYTAGGLVLLQRLAPGNAFAGPALIALAAMALLVAGFVVVQHRGIGLAGALVRRVSLEWLNRLSVRRIGGVAAAQDQLRAIYARRGALVSCGVVHLATWIASGLEIWIALRLMGVPLAVPAVLALESLLYGARSVAFMVPNALGVQEGAYIALGALLGLSPEAALALSLLKRARDVAIGVPVLLAWQAIEGRRALTRLNLDAAPLLAGAEADKSSDR